MNNVHNEIVTSEQPMISPRMSSGMSCFVNTRTLCRSSTTFFMHSKSIVKQVILFSTSSFYHICEIRPYFCNETLPLDFGLSSYSLSFMATVDSFETVKRLVFERRSVRKYLNKEIPIEELKEVLALAQVDFASSTHQQRAPTSLNAQPYKVIVVRTPEDKQKLAKHMLLNNATFVNTASATLIVCCDLGSSTSSFRNSQILYPTVMKLLKWSWLTEHRKRKRAWLSVHVWFCFSGFRNSASLPEEGVILLSYEGSSYRILLQG